MAKKKTNTGTDDDFLSVLAGCTEACAKADLQDNNWMPPDGSYTVFLASVSAGTKDKDGVKFAHVTPRFTIVDGDMKEKDFTDFYWIEPNPTEASISLKNLLRLATCLAGREIKDPIEAITVLRDAEGDFLQVEVYRTTSKRNGKVYCNIRFLTRLEEMAEEDETENTAS